MDKARVAIFEDHEMVADSLTRGLEWMGHSAVATAKTLGEAEQLIANLAEDGLDLAIVDGNLTRGDISGRDGANITRLLKGKFSGIVVIGMSGNNEVEGADHQIIKGQGNDLQAIESIIAKL